MMVAEGDKPPNIGEMYVRATGAEDLTLRLDRRCQVDYLIAAGMVGVPDRLGLSLYRLFYRQDEVEIAACLSGLWEVMSSERARRNWQRADDETMARVICIVLRWWRDHTCHTCSGRGYEVQEGAPHLDMDRPCRTCHGTGERPIERSLRKYGGDWIGRGKWLQERIKTSLVATGDRMAAKVARKMLDAGLLSIAP